jgi:hypothetical protein
MREFQKLENFYLGDLELVSTFMPLISDFLLFRTPDTII